MNKRDLAKEIRKVFTEHAPNNSDIHSNLVKMSDDELIQFEITCPCCGDTKVNDVELIVVINEATDFKNFQDLCLKKAVENLMIIDKAAKEDWEQLKKDNTGKLLEPNFENLDKLISAYYQEHRRYSGFYSVPIDKKKLVEITNKCNSELFKHFKLWDGNDGIVELLKEHALIDNDEFVAYELIEDEGKLVPLPELKKYLIKELKENRFKQNALYSRITFSHDIFDYFFAGKQFEPINTDKTILSDFNKIRDLLEDNLKNKGVLLPELRELIEKQFGEIDTISDGFELSTYEVSLYWFLPVHKAHEILTNLSKWLDFQPYGKTLKHIGGHMEIYDSE